MLVAFSEATDGPNWRNNRSWGESPDIALWHGVTVDSEGRVISLKLSGNGLKGGLVLRSPRTPRVGLLYSTPGVLQTACGFSRRSKIEGIFEIMTSRMGFVVFYFGATVGKKTLTLCTSGACELWSEYPTNIGLRRTRA